MSNEGHSRGNSKRKRTERGNGQKWWEKERASSRAASQNESEESKNGENPEERSLDPEPVGVPWQPSHFILFFTKKALQTEGQQLVWIKIAKQALISLNFPPHDVWNDVITIAAVMIAPRRTCVFTSGAVKNPKMIRWFLKKKEKKKTESNVSSMCLKHFILW